MELHKVHGRKIREEKVSALGECIAAEGTFSEDMCVFEDQRALPPPPKLEP